MEPNLKMPLLAMAINLYPKLPDFPRYSNVLSPLHALVSRLAASNDSFSNSSTTLGNDESKD